MDSCSRASALNMLSVGGNDEIKNSGAELRLNNKIKGIKRRCYVVFDIYRLFQRISLDLSVYAQVT